MQCCAFKTHLMLSSVYFQFFELITLAQEERESEFFPLQDKGREKISFYITSLDLQS